MLVVAWSPISNLIASGSEDCHFKIWDPMGQLLFKSAPRLYPITSIAWSPDGAFCAFTTFSSVCVSSAYGVLFSFRQPTKAFFSRTKSRKKLISSIVLNVCRFRAFSIGRAIYLKAPWTVMESLLYVGHRKDPSWWLGIPLEEFRYLIWSKGVYTTRLRSVLLSIIWKSSSNFFICYPTD